MLPSSSCRLSQAINSLEKGFAEVFLLARDCLLSGFFSEMDVCFCFKEPNGLSQNWEPCETDNRAHSSEHWGLSFFRVHLFGGFTGKPKETGGLKATFCFLHLNYCRSGYPPIGLDWGFAPGSFRATNEAEQQCSPPPPASPQES